MLDTIKDIEKYHLTSDRVGEKIVDYMNKKNKIKVKINCSKLLKEHYSKKTINNLVELFLAYVSKKRKITIISIKPKDA